MLALIFSILFSAQLDAPVFEVASPAEERATGRPVRLTGDFTATLRTNSGAVTVRDVIALRRTDRAIPGFPTEAHLVTTFGDRLTGNVVGGDGRFIHFRPTTGAAKPDTTWKIPLSSAVVLWLADTPANTPLDASRFEWLAGVKNQDVLRFRNGDTARGTIDGLETDAEMPSFSFRPTSGEKRGVAARELSAIAFNPALARSRKPGGAYARIVLTDGSRIALTHTAITEGIVTGTALFGQKVELRLFDVAALDVVGGKCTFLSDLKPQKVDQSGFLGVTWSWSADRSVRGDALRVASESGHSVADKGLGTHPRTILSYDLGGGYQRFETLVGLDPGAAISSRVIVRVLVDGREREMAGLRPLAAGKAVAIRVDVRGAKELVLVTDFGPAGGVGGDVNWAEARLIK